MRNRPVVEVCVESLERAVAAERGGADRIEWCARLATGGVTPDAASIRAIRRKVRIPIHVLIRPRHEDDFCSDEDFAAMRRDIKVAKELGVDNVVLGVLKKSFEVDRQRTSELVQLARPMAVTFHRAFDVCHDWRLALEEVIASGAQRVLTSGGESRVTDGLSKLAELAKAAGDRIAIMPGGGIRAENVHQILEMTGAREVHTSLVCTSAEFEPRSQCKGKFAVKDSEEFEARVRNFIRVAASKPAISRYPLQ